MSCRRDTFWVGSTDGSVMLYYRAAPSYLANGCTSICSWISLPQISCRLHSPFSLGLKTSIKGPVESIATYQTLIAAAGDQDLQLWVVGVHTTGLKSTSVVFSLSTMSQSPSGPRKADHTLLDIPLTLPRSVLDGKCLHTIHFLPNQDQVVLSFVDSNPAGQCSILAVYSFKPWRLIRSVTINRRIGLAAISEDSHTFAFTNLFDGIEIFSLPRLIHCGSIPQNIRQQSNVTLGIFFVGNDHVVAGESGGIGMYHTTTRTLALSYHKVLVAGSGEGNLIIWGWKELKVSRRCCTIASIPSQNVLCAGTLLLLLLYLPLIHILTLLLKQQV
ncbi:hypothetical protein GALMADRAFT_232961 [Galerina marginata CBS 339.88]|uniref:Uncharacterized protein n=1 Tax=Galerina marginata (strain CBS 339.88) TaxID=685588 RepID=A0A067S372_GALM3|nr:hypothetical protein GALMADRAFT_232961 [Galerina marginata CBS 339.88]